MSNKNQAPSKARKKFIQNADFLFQMRYRDNISRPIVVTIFSGSRFLINREVVNEREGSYPKSLVSWLAHIHNYA